MRVFQKSHINMIFVLKLTFLLVEVHFKKWKYLFKMYYALNFL